MPYRKPSRRRLALIIGALGLLLVHCERNGLGEPEIPCGDQSGPDPACAYPSPACESHEVLAYRAGCGYCVDPATCLPSGSSECHDDVDCEETERCDPCVTSSCPTCNDCVRGCVPHGCEIEGDPECNMLSRPQCAAANHTSLVRDGCWECVPIGSCRCAPCP